MSREPSSGLDRRTFLTACGAAGATLALGCGGSPADPAPDAADSPDVDAAGVGPLAVPPIDEGELVGDVRVFRLDLRTGTVDFGGTAPTATYGANGAFLGPTLRFRRGERVRLEVTNSLGEPTTLHWHGMHIPARSDGGPYQTIAPGATWSPEYDVTQRAMTGWYHPHPMHSTAAHVYMGIAGMILVDDPAAPAALPATYGVDDLPLILQDRRFAADGTHPYSPGQTLAMHDMMAGLRGDTMLVNGAIRPRGAVARGLVRLRVLNGSNARNYHLGFADDRRFLLVASDGGLLDAPVETTRVLLGPGERAELLVDFGADTAGAEVVLQSYSGEVYPQLFTGQMGANLADELDRTTFELATFVVGDPPPAPVAPPTSFEPIARLAEGDAARTRQLAISLSPPNWLLNGARTTELDAVPPALDFQIPAGDVELWELSNTSGMAHPIHLHNRHFQVLDVDGAPPPAALAGWKDTVIVAPGQLVRILVPFEGTPDAEVPYMFHCHILEHEDHGMMGRFFLV